MGNFVGIVRMDKFAFRDALETGFDVFYSIVAFFLTGRTTARL